MGCVPFGFSADFGCGISASTAGAGIDRVPTPLFTGAVVAAACLWGKGVTLPTGLMSALVRHYIFFTNGNDAQRVDFWIVEKQ